VPDGEVQRHPYGPHRSQFGDLRLPEAAGPHPVVVLLHGGYWRARYGLDLMDRLAADLTTRGYATWNLEYRRLGLLRGGGWPETFDDVAAGIDALAEMGLDRELVLDDVAVVGHSAGGHLALWAAARGEALDRSGAGGLSRWVAARPRPRVRIGRVVAQAPVSDLDEASRRRLSGAVVHRLLGGAPDRVADRYAVTSPRALLPLGVPQLLVHGDADDAVPLELSTAYAEAAGAAGDDVDLIVLPGVGHLELIDPAHEAWRTVVAWLD
jgi:acetyl esterase/lipase